MSAKVTSLDAKRAPRPQPAERFTWLRLVMEDDSLSHATKAVAYWLASFTNHVHREAWPSYGLLASKSGIVRTSAIRAVNELIKAGYVAKHKAVPAYMRNRPGADERVIFTLWNAAAGSPARTTGSVVPGPGAPLLEASTTPAAEDDDLIEIAIGRGA